MRIQVVTPAPGHDVLVNNPGPHVVYSMLRRCCGASHEPAFVAELRMGARAVGCLHWMHRQGRRAPC
eukprot:4063816-Pyramimonas_sp.AAC.1